MQQLKDLLKAGRIAKTLTTREVSEKLKIDQALISKFENGLRRPTRGQVLQLSELFGIDADECILAWLTEKILSELKDEPQAIQALKAAEAQFINTEIDEKVAPQFEKLLAEMETLKAMLGKK
ncbi:helix-turn-helix transcriptional regulator [Flavobacterium sp.]|uniref:helix-turn-helix domain-containing protein n=1 Tax=Flavobacterium sp. TaxID=239 RepID=UPI0025BED8B1|nr:helix-turn-helix transcriptional regulator [Flavobacterium sp.]